MQVSTYAKFLGCSMPKNGIQLPLSVLVAWYVLVWLLAEFTRLPAPFTAEDSKAIYYLLGFVFGPVVWAVLVAKQEAGTALIGLNDEVVFDPKRNRYLWRFSKLRRNSQCVDYEPRELKAAIDVAFSFASGSAMLLTFLAEGEIFGDTQSFVKFRRATGYRGSNCGHCVFRSELEDQQQRKAAMSDVAKQLQQAMRVAVTAHLADLARLFGSPEGIRPEDNDQQTIVAQWLTAFLEPVFAKVGMRSTFVGYSFRKSI